jgi:hypothetical protein
MTICLRRREFLAALGGAAAWQLAARAQQLVIPTIGFLDSTTANARAIAGFVKGRNVAIEFRWPEGKLDRLSELANDLVRKRVAAIATNAVYSLAAVKAATSTIPTVFVTGGDPVAGGYTNRPAGKPGAPRRSGGPLSLALCAGNPARPAVRADPSVDGRACRQLPAGIQPHGRDRQRRHTGPSAGRLKT